MIQQELHALQERERYLSPEGLRALSARLNVPLRRLHEVASCFPHYRLQPPPSVEMKVCRDMSCHLRGADDYLAALRAAAAEVGAADVSISGVSCLGQCDAPPAVVLGHAVHRGLTVDGCRRLLLAAIDGRDGSQHSEHSSETSKPTPTGWRIDPYEGREDYAACRKFVEGNNGDRLIEELKTAELLGMGGAGVPAGRKWADVREARGDRKYVIVNGDESEPGTFKDREILLRTPHLVIEGVILGGMLIGAERGFIYIRHEYEPQIAAVRAAIARAEALGVCGRNALGTGRDFPIEVYVSPGGYICGEQSALIEAMEDRRAEPRNKPPTIETNGYRDRPTLLSNVETFAWVPSIWHRGGAWYRDLGVDGCKGARFFSISGHLKRPGVFEVPIGTSLRELIYKHAGGLPDGMTLKAVATSGPSGGFLPAMLPLSDGGCVDLLDLKLDLQAFRDIGQALGAGLVVYGDTADMLDQAVNATEFFRNESCGKCVPCRIGCDKLAQLGRELRDERPTPEMREATAATVTDLHQTMEVASICGLGVVGANPLITALRYFRSDVEAHGEKR